jgi:GTP cyclohydrolase I
MNFHTRDLNLSRLCNEALDTPMTEAERRAMITAAARKVEELFDILRIDHQNDHNTRETPQRVAKMYVEELLEGRFTAPPKITEFDNAQAYDQLIVTGPIELRSMCAHHMMPIYGAAYIGILLQLTARSSAYPSTTGLWSTSPRACRFRRSSSSRSVSISWI